MSVSHSEGCAVPKRHNPRTWLSAYEIMLAKRVNETIRMWEHYLHTEYSANAVRYNGSKKAKEMREKLKVCLAASQAHRQEMVKYWVHVLNMPKGIVAKVFEVSPAMVSHWVNGRKK